MAEGVIYVHLHLLFMSTPYRMWLHIIFSWNRGTIIVAPSPERTSGLLSFTPHDVYGLLHFDQPSLVSEVRKNCVNQQYMLEVHRSLASERQHSELLY